MSATRDTQGPPDRASRDGAGSNRLAGETSPYLLQHAHNPVDWYPWGEEALGRAKELDRPILLSVGYAACHWCHVMERESFEDPGTAALMNDHFVCIKVDREERPDIDEIYMAATIGLTGSGGWPMTVFLTPDGEPFFAGTYFPPRDSMGRPGFPRLLELVARAWRGERDEICSQAARVGEHVARQIGEASPGSLSWESIDLAVASLRRAFDSRWGGFGGAPKFPAPHTLELLLRHHRRTRDDHALAMATTTLDAMARGGIFDHVGGGFARYSTDERWLVPHFEKMLYDNAQLARAYVDAFVATGESRFADVARATLDYLLAEMQSPEGGFYSSTDADSEGEEGKFFVWRRAEIEELLDRDDARAVCAAYDVTEEGNWEGKTILNRPVAPAVVASQLGCSVEELEGRLARARRALYDARSKRVAPACDDKVLASWNGLAVGALAEAGRVLGERRYLEAARRAARFLLERMRRPDGSLAHSARAGRVRDESFLEDYAFVADALLDLAEAVEQDAAAELREAALGLARRMLDGFADSVGGGFFASPREQRTPVVRARDPMSGPLPSPTAVAARVLARLAALTDRAEWRELAGGALASLGGAVARMPSAHASVLVALDLILEGPVEVVLVGSRADPALLELERELARHYLPNRCIVHHEPSEAERPNEVVSSSLLQGKQLVDGHAAAYVCRGSTCLAPVTTAAALGRLLEGELSSIPTSDDAARSSVAPPRLAGAATARGTGRFEARARASLGLDRAAEPGSERVGGTEPLPPFVSLGRTGLRVGRFGFGGYRVDDASPENSAALEAALLSGCNLIDTSTNYTGGASERLVGKVLSQLVRRGELRRDEIVVVSKIGYLQGRSLERARERERVGRAWPEIVRYADDCWHCVHPDFLREELERSLDRLGLETLDLLLLHNPEYFFSDRAHRHVDVGERERAAFYDRIERAFAYLESAVRDGKIRGYGVSSNSVAEPQSDPERTDLRRLIAAAERAAGTDNHFVALQLPVNLVESRAVIAAVDGEHDQDSSEHGEHPSLLDLARQRSIAVLANRPLNAIVEGKLARLVDAHDDLSPTTHGRLDPRSRLAQRAAHSRARIVHQWLDGLIGGSTEGEPLSRKVLWALASTPGIDVVLVGMRRPAYVSDAMAVLGWGRARDVRKSYRALRDVDFTTLV